MQRSTEKMLNDLKEWIAVPSVMGQAAAGAPFGAETERMLRTFLATAQKYGMRTHNENGYCGWAEIGEGEKIIGILGHLDVVPAGDGWSHDPFTLVVQDGMLYGRGVADDKGPTLAALHAMRSVLCSGKPLRHRIRLIAGLNEENGSECIAYYRAHCEIPAASFVPDADFPLINSEKGILHVTLSLPPDEVLRGSGITLRAGLRPNIVPDLAAADIPKTCALYETLAALGKDNGIFRTSEVATVIVQNGMRIEDFSVHFFEDKLTLEARGVAGHAMAPEKGENAAVKLMLLLNGLLHGASPALAAAAKYLHAPDPAATLGIAASDDISGALTVNVGMASIADGVLRLTLDCRLPVCADHAAVEKKIAACFAGSTLHEDRYSPNLYVPQDSPLVLALLGAYTSVTGEPGKCLYCGGGTYARELPNAVAFGPTFEGLETNIHNADECFPVELFTKLPDIYAAAILALDKAF